MKTRWWRRLRTGVLGCGTLEKVEAMMLLITPTREIDGISRFSFVRDDDDDYGSNAEIVELEG